MLYLPVVLDCRCRDSRCFGFLAEDCGESGVGVKVKAVKLVESSGAEPWSS
jgi:hypothetical protein